MLQKFETIYKVYSDIITTTQRNTDIGNTFQKYMIVKSSSAI